MQKEVEVLPFLDSPVKLATVENILRGKNRIEAYKLAGGKSKSSQATSVIVSKWLKQANVKKYISMREAELNMRTKAKTGIDRDWVVSNYKEVYDRCMQKKAVMCFDKVKKIYVQVTEEVEHKDGTITEEGVWNFDSRGALGGLDGISRVMGFNAPVKFDGTLRHVQVKEIAELTPEELLKLAEMQPVDERHN